MEVLIFIFAAIISYLVGGWNPAITFSKAIYKKDIRDCGSGNPGFTNFKRTFGGKWAWWVFALDISKAAIVVSIFAFLFSKNVGSFKLGAAYAGAFCFLGHLFPIWYKFKGGKGFLVCFSTIWFIDYRAGLVALALMVILLLITKYMSLSTVIAILSCPVTLLLTHTNYIVIIIYSLCALLMAFRHKENFKRLVKGTESKFYLHSKNKK